MNGKADLTRFRACAPGAAEVGLSRWALRRDAEKDWEPALVIEEVNLDRDRGRGFARPTAWSWGPRRDGRDAARRRLRREVPPHSYSWASIQGTVGPLGGPVLAAGETRSIAVAGVCGIPAGARALSLNVTVTGSAASGSLSVYASDQSRPVSSTMNFSAGRTRANNATASLSLDGTGGQKVWNGSAGSVHVIIDVNGYFQ